MIVQTYGYGHCDELCRGGYYLVPSIDNIDLTTPYYLLMHRDMQQTPRVRAFADFVRLEIKSFRALVAKAADAPR